ncbi:MAG TPA: AIR synthase family protein [Armatimonadota bacterium]|jgi:hydrogenase maturation factor
MPSAELPVIGKISPEVFSELIYPRLGAPSADILVGPQSGVDVGIFQLGDQAVALTTDPVFIVPQYGWERAAWFAIHILLSDAVTSGLPPRYLSIDLNLPLDIDREGLDLTWGVIHRECARYGVSVITGHTARYEGCNYPMVGGATVLAIGPVDSYVTPALARAGDAIIITKGPAIETTGLFAAAVPGLIEARLGAEFRARAEQIFYQMSVVEDARIAVAQGVRENGVTCMHDATECGIWGALWEIADAAGLGLRVEQDRIVAQPECLELCASLGLDPFACISEGTLVLTCRAHAAERIVAALIAEGIPASVVGEMREREYGIRLVREGREEDLVHPRVDPFWAAFGKALAEAAG